MARRNLSRTAIEGGRASSNKWQRRQSSQVERVNVKSVLNAAHGDTEAFENAVYENRRPVRKEFNDKLQPVYRYLDAQVGRPWDKVRSEIIAKFDSRTTAGRHILYDHLLNSVVEEGVVHRYGNWVVDKHGILHVAEGSYYHRTRRRLYSGPFPDYAKNRVANWLNNRCVGMIGTKLFWFTLATKTAKWGARHAYMDREKLLTRWGVPGIGWNGKLRVSEPNVIKYLFERVETKDYLGNPLLEPRIVYSEMSFANYRQDVEFSRTDRKYFESLPAWVQAMLLKFSPAA